MGPELKGVWPWPMAIDHQGRVLMYFGTRSLMRVDGNRVETVWPKEDVAVGFIHVIYRGASAMLLGGETGLARYDGRRFAVLPASRYPALAHISGIIQLASGDTWLISGAGVVRLPTAALDRAFDHPGSPLKPEVIDLLDGAPGIAQFGRTNDIVRESNGRLWFAMSDGIASIDPGRLRRNMLPPTVLIRSLTAGGKSYPSPKHPDLPEGTSELQIDYTATSLAMPERVRFRYKLDGVDTAWIDPGTRRQAFYTNLSPGTYHFQVIAANESGVWNTTGAAVDFTIPPTFLQSRLFLGLCVAGAFVILFLLYSLRMGQVANQVRSRLEERLVERERIARELHDTLLQGFQALVLRFQNIVDRMPPNQPARYAIEQELERADAILIEGRNRVRDLRVAREPADFFEIFSATVRDIALDSATSFGVQVIGDARELHPVVQDEITRIGNEAIINAYNHARASRIKVSLIYAPDSMTLRVTDDGIGIDQSKLTSAARPDRFGIVGMRERAARIHAKLAIRGTKGVGTEVELIVPATAAYASGKARRRMHLLSHIAAE